MSNAASSNVKFLGVTQRPQDVATGMLFVPVFQDGDGLEDLPGLDQATRGEVGRARAAGEFKGKAYEFFITPKVGNGWKADRIVLVGAGRRAECDVERLRRVAAACGYTAQLRSVESVAWLVRPAMDALVAAQAAVTDLPRWMPKGF
jgi:leucyl aminopeptidase